jgi:hypothetical protein
LCFVALFFLLSVKLESGMGHKGFAIYLLMATTLTGAVSSFFMLIMFMASSPDYFYETTLTGHAGVIVSVLVGNVRLDVEDQFLPAVEQGRVKTRTVLLPGLVGYVLLAHILPFSWLKDSCLAIVAFFVSYFLLRHLEYNIEDSGSFYAYRTVYADEPFSLDAFFPQVMQPFIRAVSALLGRSFRKVFGCCLSKRQLAPNDSAVFNRTYNSAYSSVNSAEQGTLSGSPFAKREEGDGLRKTNSVADRRRALALKALDQKLAQMSKEPEVALDDDTDTAPTAVVADK